LDVYHYSLIYLNGGHGENCGFDLPLLTSIVTVLKEVSFHDSVMELWTAVDRWSGPSFRMMEFSSLSLPCVAFVAQDLWSSHP